MTSEKKRIPINEHYVAPDGVHAADAGSGAPGIAAEPDGSGAAAAASTSAPPVGFPPLDIAVAETGPEGDAGVVVDATPLEVVTAERDRYLDALQRLQAEFDNYRRRSQRESSEARARARCGVLGEFLAVFDNLARALDAAEHHQEGKVLEGVRLTHSLFADLLRREGVEEIHSLGSAFDPHLHEAIVSLPSEESEGTVVQVVEKGYTAGETVLRPARVAVSAGPPVRPAEE
ncbi:MAG: nucleotide exchange factor GrpE [Thermoleophilia bacterium]